MKKVTVTENQAKALDSIKEELTKDDNRVFSSVLSALNYKQRRVGFSWDRMAADELTDEQFLDALVFGYEVEQPKPTADEIVTDLIGKANNDIIKPHFAGIDINSYNYGILRAIDELSNAGIKFVLEDEQ